ncbi:hypothetical protein V6N13_112169 [Hibiscus sabdariffa]
MVELPSFGRNLEAQGPRVLDVANFPPLQAVNQNVPVDSVADGKGVLPLLDILADGARQWENALLGNFLGKSPPLGVFQKMVDKLWGREGSITICFLAPSVYVLNFPSQKVRDWVLVSGPWHIQQKALMLRKWVPGMISEVLDLSSAPVWIKLWHVPLELFSQKGLGCIASALGKPLYTDRAIVLKQSLEFAKICVNVDASFELPKFVLVELSEGNCIDVGVELVWAPPRCEHCCIFGHLGDNCVKKKGQDQVVDAVSSDLVVEGGEQKVVPENNDDLILDVVEELVVVLESVDQDVVDAISILSGVVQDHDLVLETENVNQFCLLVEDPDCPKKSRAAADGVYVLMNQLKPKGKGGGNKKKGKGGKRGGGSPVAP